MIRLVIMAVACLPLNVAFGETTFDVELDCKPYADLWFRPARSEDWLRPPKHLSENRPSAEVTLVSGLNHFLVVMDKAKNEDRLGWYDFDAVVKPFADKGEIPTISLSCLFVMEKRTRTVEITKAKTEVRTQEYAVSHMVPEQRTKMVRVWSRSRRRWEWQERTYTVTKPVWETRTREYTVSVPYTEEVEQTYEVSVHKPVLKVKSGGDVHVIEPVSLNGT
jgi:hypothetical protein